ncbi:hypothetical protein EBZ35_00975 [bacterium]|nr:hypothetical protein [bacterium]
MASSYWQPIRLYNMTIASRVMGSHPFHTGEPFCFLISCRHVDNPLYCHPSRVASRLNNPSILIALIHCHNQERLRSIRPHLAHLASCWSDQYTVQQIDISHQPPTPSQLIWPTFWECIKRDVLHTSTQQKWSRYIECPTRSFLQPVKWAYYAMNYAIQKEKGRAAYRKKHFLELMISDKHVRAWDAFLDSNHDLLMVLEDDAIFDSQSIERLSVACYTAMATTPSNGVYVDLAGGYPLEQLHVNALITAQQHNMTTFSKPISNTACGYLMNQALAQDFKNTLCYNPSSRSLCADWLINDCMMAAHRRLPITCFHMTPSALQHGSISGHYVPIH